MLFAIRGSELRNCQLDYWPAMSGGIVLEWSDGPNAREAREALMLDLVDSGVALCADDLTLDPDRFGHSGENVVHMCIDDVPVEFRAQGPVGWSAFVENNREAMRRMLRDKGWDGAA
ncbi:hypothetical protein SAMN05216207_10803 [Pseudonocardia ammonioxydans]|uniref:Uncharacterized protein n=1 Tax=Pseudonocardia ammonioxydans TaxID=260086 RepID=A0A1I5HZR9_PSUAM|nr:hypothetical protein SAMN05216207_10803 [Pseudonocardia ammonioxydans]